MTSIASASTIVTTCSGCVIDVKLDLRKETAAVLIPSNGRRGSLHVPARTAVVGILNDGELVTWDCPACEHPDSFDLTA